MIELVEEKKYKPERTIKDLGVRQTERKRLVIIGGGFAGLHMVKGLKACDYQIVLIDKRNHHTFQPLLYQVATSGLEAASIAYPLRKPLKKHPDFHFRLASVESVDSDKNQLQTSRGSISYDYLVMAMGAETNYFGMESVEKHAMPMKSVGEAMSIRNQMLKNYEEALLNSYPDEREKLTNIVIAGGGPTGVELAGALAEFRHYIMPKDYPDLDPALSKIYLIELLPALLPPMSDEASSSSQKYLEAMGVDVRTKTQIESYDGEVVKTDKVTSLPSCWCGLAVYLEPLLKDWEKI